MYVTKICVKIVHCALSAFFYGFERFEKCPKYCQNVCVCTEGSSVVFSSRSLTKSFKYRHGCCQKSDLFQPSGLTISLTITWLYS